MLSREEALNLDLNNFKKVHLIGITSAFNSFCANYLLEEGIEVTASEYNQDCKEAKGWIDRGILYPGGHSAKYITKDIDLVIFPNGPIPGNPECEETEKKGIPTITIGQLTGLISKNFKVVAIAGTHGKTTTSALVAWLFYKSLDKKPNFIIGDKILDWNQSWNYNPNSEYLVIEACEYKKQFLDRAPQSYITVITNIELDHTDFYPTQDSYNSAFSEFISNSEYVITDTSELNIVEVLKEVSSEIKVVDMNKFKDKYSNVKSSLIGEHNRENVLRACGVAEVLNIQPFFEDFPGVNSRFEYKGNTPNGMKTYSDYAHNPRKIKACLNGTREAFPDKKIVFVWEPHSYERTYTFKEDFVKSLELADIIYIPNIFAPVREQEEYKDVISTESFVEFLQGGYPKKEIIHTKTLEKTTQMLLGERFNDNYVTILASAGELRKIFPLLKLDK